MPVEHRLGDHGPGSWSNLKSRRRTEMPVRGDCSAHTADGQYGVPYTLCQLFLDGFSRHCSGYRTVRTDAALWRIAVSTQARAAGPH
jgi:hypothetical protein